MKKMKMRMNKKSKKKSLPKNLKDKENHSDKAKDLNSITIEVEIKEVTKEVINLGKIRVEKVETGKITTREAIKEVTSLGKTKVDKVETGKITTEITITVEESPSTEGEENLSTTDVEMINFHLKY